MTYLFWTATDHPFLIIVKQTICVCVGVLGAKILSGRCVEAPNMIPYEWFHTGISFAANVVTVGNSGIIERNSHSGTHWLFGHSIQWYNQMSPSTPGIMVVQTCCSFDAKWDGAPGVQHFTSTYNLIQKLSSPLTTNQLRYSCVQLCNSHGEEVMGNSFSSYIQISATKTMLFDWRTWRQIGWWFGCKALRPNQTTPGPSTEAQSNHTRPIHCVKHWGPIKPHQGPHPLSFESLSGFYYIVVQRTSTSHVGSTTLPRLVAGLPHIPMSH